jgi:hypothetical protein
MQAGGWEVEKERIGEASAKLTKIPVAGQTFSADFLAGKRFYSAQ